MNTKLAAGAASICTVLMTTTALYADVTPAQVWDAIQKQASATGATLTPGSVDTSGDTLTVTNLVIASKAELAIADVTQSTITSVTVPALLLEDMGDGTVKLSAEGDIVGKSQTTASEGPASEADIVIRKSDAMSIISGTPEAMNYAVTAPEMVIDVDARTLGEGAPPPAKMTFTLSGLNGAYNVESAGGQRVVSDLKASGMKMALTGADPETNATVNMTMQLANLAMASDFTLPEGVDTAKMAEALAAGFGGSGKVSYGVSSFELESQTEQGPVNVASSAQSGQFDVALSRDGLRYAASGLGTVIDVQTAQFPAPINVSLAETAFDFAFPLSKTDAPQPFTGKIGLVGLSVSEELWAMFDPQQTLPRDPATLVIDLTGKVTTLMDLFSPEAAQAEMPPVQIESLDINKVQLTVAGADLTGTGAMTFDNSMGLPMPLGAVDLKLAGANKLMDSLVAMGLMPQDQVMFARMMLGLYAVPAGDDLLTSKIEFKEGGQILANGQRIQ